MTDPDNYATFNNMIDLASESIGGEVIAASDEFFAAKENIIKSGRGTWDPDLFSDTGKVYDGWESRRRRTAGNDWVVIKLANPGVVKVVDIDTNHFLGNAPQFASLEGTNSENFSINDEQNWRSLLKVSAVRPGAQNLFLTSSTEKVSHIRLQIYPDGGVARLRLYGQPQSVPNDTELTDFANLLHGGEAIVASDMYFGEMRNLIKPTPPPNMGDGWETKRRRGPGHDWVVIQLGKAIVPERVEVDTTHFKGNYPDRCTIEVCNEPDLPCHQLIEKGKWVELVGESKLKPDHNHIFSDFDFQQIITHVRLNIYPDGGVSRLRVFGRN